MAELENDMDEDDVDAIDDVGTMLEELEIEFNIEELDIEFNVEEIIELEVDQVVFILELEDVVVAKVEEGLRIFRVNVGKLAEVVEDNNFPELEEIRISEELELI